MRAEQRAEDAAFEEFYTSTVRGITAQIYAMTGNWSEAQDAVQEAYARAIARWSTVSRYEQPAGWVRTVAYRIAVSSWRRSRNALTAMVRAQRVADVPEPSPDHVALVAALRRLPEVQRTAIVLHYLADLSVAEIAAETGSNENTVKARLARGRAALAVHIRDDASEEAS